MDKYIILKIKIFFQDDQPEENDWLQYMDAEVRTIESDGRVFMGDPEYKAAICFVSIFYYG